MSGITRTGTIDSVTTDLLGSGQGDKVGTLVVQFEYLDSCDASITLKGRTQRDGSGIDKTLIAVAYKSYATGANATAAIGANALVQVDATGLDIYADCTTVTTGSVSWTATPLLG